eukprot:scaffold235886_cov15-Tisochrysis_lutea.AAC.1
MAYVNLRSRNMPIGDLPHMIIGWRFNALIADKKEKNRSGTRLLGFASNYTLIITTGHTDGDNNQP